jgi:hypothetical protein
LVPINPLTKLSNFDALIFGPISTALRTRFPITGFSAIDSLTTGFSPDLTLRSLTASRDQQYEMSYGIPVADTFAMPAHRHMKEFGTTAEQLAEVAVIHRRHALRIPGAQQTEPITTEDVITSGMNVLRFLSQQLNTSSWEFEYRGLLGRRDDDFLDLIAKHFLIQKSTLKLAFCLNAVIGRYEVL